MIFGFENKGYRYEIHSSANENKTLHTLSGGIWITGTNHYGVYLYLF